MKKIMLGTLLAGMLTSSFAAPVAGVVKGVLMYDGVTKVRITKDGGGDTIRALEGTADAIKAMTATALSAKAAGSSVDMYVGPSGGWFGIEIK